MKIFKLHYQNKLLMKKHIKTTIACLFFYVNKKLVHRVILTEIFLKYQTGINKEIIRKHTYSWMLQSANELDLYSEIVVSKNKSVNAFCIIIYYYLFLIWNVWKILEGKTKTKSSVKNDAWSIDYESFPSANRILLTFSRRHFLHKFCFFSHFFNYFRYCLILFGKWQINDLPRILKTTFL